MQNKKNEYYNIKNCCFNQRTEKYESPKLKRERFSFYKNNSPLVELRRIFIL